jgi:hypothetical protein
VGAIACSICRRVLRASWAISKLDAPCTREPELVTPM